MTDRSTDVLTTDVLVIGGGTAGAIMASRLSEDASLRVLLVEAGNDTPPDAMPADIRDVFPRSTMNSSYLWPGLAGSVRAKEKPRPYAQARIMGGGSAINGMSALRGLPSAYDRWASFGAGGWTWDDVLPWFRKIEKDADRENPAEPEGLNAIARVPTGRWPPYAKALGDAAGRNGYGRLRDVNESHDDGFFQMPLSIEGDHRVTTAGLYLTEAVRRRTNLTIMPGSSVLHLVVEGAVVRGAKVKRGGHVVEVRAGRVVLSAGAIHSPAILMRSGIGPAEVLRAAGIDPLVVRPGVGDNLQNHPYLFYALTLPKASRMAPSFPNFILGGLRASSGHAECPKGDLLLYMTGRVSPRSFGVSLGMVACALYAPFSRGRVTVRGPGAEREPQVDFRMFSDARDAPRLIQVARLARTLLEDPGVRATYNEAVLLPPSQMLNQFNRQGVLGTSLALGAGTVLNAPGPIRRMAVSLAFGSHRRVGASARELSDQEVLSSSAPMGHPVGTCAIGREDDPAAVVDSSCRVIGVDGLHVVDASVMPGIPSANTNLPTVMVAERMAHRMRFGGAA